MMKRFGIVVFLLALICGLPMAVLAMAPVASTGSPGSSWEANDALVTANIGTPLWDTPLAQAGLDAPASQPPRADFSATPLQGKAPLSVSVTNTSTGTISSNEWKIGTQTVSTDWDPSPLIFQSHGEYTLSLTVRGPSGTDTKVRNQYIKVYRGCLDPPKADFAMDPAEGIAAHPVTFTDQSTGGVVSWTWDFGDGTAPVTVVDPEQPVRHTYAAAGDYDVTLTVRDFCTAPVQEDTTTKTVSILGPYADFSANPEQGTVPLTVTFTDQSRGTFDTRKWNFGDGTEVTNPSTPITHTYQQVGTYTVRLEVSGLSGNLDATKTITVLPPPPVAAFTCAPIEGRLPLTVSCTDQSTGVIDTRTWDFGDGSALVVDPRTPVTHSYLNVGEYTVALTVSGPGGSNTLTKDNHVKVVPNQRPVVEVDEQQIFLKHIGEKAILDASPSSDPDGDKLFFSWREFRDNPHLGLIPTGSDALSKVHLYFPAPGQYRYDVRVSDGDLVSAETRAITVYVPGQQGLIGYTPSDALVRVSDATIRVFPTPQDAANNVNLVDLAISDSLGRYTLEHLEPVDTTTAQTYTARVERTGFVSTDNLTISIAPNPGVGMEQHKHHIGRGYLDTMTGRVRTPDGAPIANAHVNILPGPGGIPYADTTDGAGLFTLANVPKGAWIMQLHASGYRSEVRDVNIHDGMPELEFTLQAVSETATGTLTGRVLLTGTDHPLSGAKVTLGTGADAFSNAQGVYTFNAIPLGDYILTVTRDGFEPQRLPAVQVRAGTNTLDLPISYTTRGPTVFGEVTDQASGAPVRMAMVGVQSAAGLLVRSDITDFTGYYQMRDVPTGQQTLRISAPGYETKTETLAIPGSMQKNIQLERLAGWVPSAPVPGRPEAAVAEEFIFLDNLRQSAFLDAGSSIGTDLRYIWRESADNPVLGLVPGGSETLSRIQISGFSKPGLYIYELQVKSGELLSANTAAVTVSAPGLSGNVHASPSDGIIGLSNANVRAYVGYDDAVAWNSNYVQSIQTDETLVGNFAFSLSAGSYWIVARAAEGAGFLQYGPVKRRVSPASAASQTRINVPRDEVSLSGVIRDAATNAPLENVRVVAAPGSLSESYRTTTDAQGRYRLPVVPRGSQQVLLMREGYRTEAPSLTISGNMTRDFTLGADASARLATLSGIVFAQYQGERLPVYNAEVIIGSGLYRTFTDANGYFEIAGMPPGYYFGTVRKPGYVPRGLADSGPLLLEPGDNEVDRLLPFAGNGPVIRGTVVTEQGTTIPGVTIRVLRPATGRFTAWLESPRAAALQPDDEAYLARAQRAARNTGPAQSDAGGVFQMLDIPHGPREIIAELPDGRTLRQTINVDGNQGVVFNEADFTHGQQWQLTYIAGTCGSIRGELIQYVDEGEDGSPVTAVADPGCSFVQWSDNLGSAERQDTNVGADISVTAEFTANPEVDIVPTVPDGGGRVEGGGSHRIGAHVEFQAVAESGYVFSHWTRNGVHVPNAGAVHTFTIEDNMNLEAHFRKVRGLPGVLMLLLDE